METKAKTPFYIASLDGIRALAVLLVFVAHAGLEDKVPGGFGVTVFFFLSGFLITTLLRLEFDKNTDISFKGFYLRRVFRIFPPLYIMMAIVLILYAIGQIPGNVHYDALMAQIFYLTNYYAIYAGDEHLLPGTTLLWSLAVEEHFYLAYPLIFLFLARIMNWNRMAIVMIGLCAIVLLWRCYLVFELEVPRIYTYQATDTRIDSILFGCIMGLWSNPVLDSRSLLPKKTWQGALVIFASLAVLLFCFVFRDTQFRETFRYTLQGIALFPLFYYAVANSHWIVFRWLNLPVMRWLGIYSYTMYLFHPTALSLAEHLFPGPSIISGLVGFAFTIAISSLMYTFVERYFADLRKKLHQRANAQKAAESQSVATITEEAKA